jgi:hypothetical protein
MEFDLCSCDFIPATSRRVASFGNRCIVIFFEVTAMPKSGAVEFSHSEV